MWARPAQHNSKLIHANLLTRLPHAAKHISRSGQQQRAFLPPPVFLVIRERDRTLALLDQTFQVHDPLVMFLRSDPAYDFLHADPRYRSLIQRIGLPAAY